ncbi:MAG: hypothetical protein AB1523_08240 [Bacillota bacterium]
MATLYEVKFRKTERKLTIISDNEVQFHTSVPPWGSWLNGSVMPTVLETALHVTESPSDSLWNRLQAWLDAWKAIPDEKIFEPMPSFEYPDIFRKIFFREIDFEALLPPELSEEDSAREWGEYVWERLERIQQFLKLIEKHGEELERLFQGIPEEERFFRALLNDILLLEFLAWACLGLDFSEAPASGVFRKVLQEILDQMPLNEFISLSPMQRFAALKPPFNWLVMQSRTQYFYALSTNKSGRAINRASIALGGLNKMVTELTLNALTDSILAVAWREFTWALESGMKLTRCHVSNCKIPILVPDSRSKFCAWHSAPPHAPEQIRKAYERARLRNPLTWYEWSRRQKYAKPPGE